MATGIVDVGSGTLEELVETDYKIFASINQTVTGSELWVVNFSVILPLDLISFNGELVQNDGVLDWKTANEKNTLEFIIERSLNGNNFEPVGRVASGVTGNYTYIDKDITVLKSSTIYYRLKQVDIDSRYTYSKVVAINLNTKQHFSIYPNPATGRINLQTGNNSSGNIRYRIIDNVGKTILQSSSQVTTNGGISIDINTLAKGIYYVDLTTTGLDKKTIQFIKQ